MMPLHALLTTHPVMPVVVLDALDDAVPLAHALVAGGVHILEITLRSAAALSAIRLIKAELPHVCVGAGTILSTAQLDAAIAAGANFGVTPGVLASILDAAQQNAFPLLPGVQTVTEAMQLRARGMTTMKFFPALAAGGVPWLHALYGPLPDLKFCPTGGVSVENAPQFLQLPNVLCVGGSWLSPQTLMRAKNWTKITELANQSLHLRQ